MSEGLFESIDQIIIQSKPESDEFMLCINIIGNFAAYNLSFYKINESGNIPRILAEVIKNKVGKYPKDSIVLQLDPQREDNQL